MSHENKMWIEGYIVSLSERKYSYFMIQKRGDMYGIRISNHKKGILLFVSKK